MTYQSFKTLLESLDTVKMFKESKEGAPIMEIPAVTSKNIARKPKQNKKKATQLTINFFAQ